MAYKSVTTMLKEVRAPKIAAPLRKKAFNAVYAILKPTYFKEIPLHEIIEALRKLGIVVLQEDNTEWSGILLGSSANVTFALGPIESGVKSNYGHMMYESYSNVLLVLSWYKDHQRKTNQIEVTGYIS